jgi:quercetin dioxygenase-like cupin family protein
MNGELIKVGQLEIRYLVDGSKAGGLGVFELTVPPGARVPPPHSHRDNEEFFYVLEGSINYSVDEDVRELKAGEWMSTPRGSVHAFKNNGSQAARALVVLTPDIGARYFHDVAAVVNAGGPPDPAKLSEVMSRYGLAPAASPQPKAA